VGVLSNCSERAWKLYALGALVERERNAGDVMKVCLAAICLLGSLQCGKGGVGAAEVPGASHADRGLFMSTLLAEPDFDRLRDLMVPSIHRVVEHSDVTFCVRSLGPAEGSQASVQQLFGTGCLAAFDLQVLQPGIVTVSLRDMRHPQRQLSTAGFTVRDTESKLRLYVHIQKEHVSIALDSDTAMAGATQFTGILPGWARPTGVELVDILTISAKVVWTVGHPKAEPARIATWSWSGANSEALYERLTVKGRRNSTPELEAELDRDPLHGKPLSEWPEPVLALWIKHENL
jgi:hypothetical protein